MNETVQKLLAPMKQVLTEAKALAAESGFKVWVTRDYAIHEGDQPADVLFEVFPGGRTLYWPDDKPGCEIVE